MKKLSLLLMPLFFMSCVALTHSKEVKFVGSMKSNIYHYDTCRYAEIIRPRYRIEFKTPEEAIKLGYSPCRICRPPTKEIK